MKVQVSTSGFSDLGKRIADAGRQGAYAASAAINETAKQVRKGLTDEMARSFDRPTPFTLNSIRIKYASKENLEAFVWLKDEAGKGTPADKYLRAEIFAGQRSAKRFEVEMHRAGLLPAGMLMVPAAGAQLDQYGNVMRSQVTQIRSQLGISDKSGFASNASNSAASRRSRRRQGVSYFALPAARGKLRPGIYQRRLDNGADIRPVFLFVRAPNYRQRLDFFGVADRVVAESLSKEFDKALDAAMRTAFYRTQLTLG